MKKIRFAVPSIFLTLLCVIFFCGTFSIKVALYGSLSGVGVGPKFIPFLTIGFLFALAVANFILEWPHRHEIAKREDKNGLSLILSMAILTACFLLMKLLGFIIVGTVFLFGEFVLLNPGKCTKREMMKYFIFSLVISSIVFAAFKYGFRLGVPTGTLWY